MYSAGRDSLFQKDYHCSTTGCIRSYLLLRNLEKHEFKGGHKFKPKTQTLLDYSIDCFNRKIETTEIAEAGRATDSFSSFRPAGNDGQFTQDSQSVTQLQAV